MKPVVGVAAAIWLFGAAPSLGGWINGNDVAKWCAKDEKSCLSYVSAIAAVLDDGNNINGFSACFGVGTTARELTDVSRRFLAKNPPLGHHSAASLVAWALQDAYPCG